MWRLRFCDWSRAVLFAAVCASPSDTAAAQGCGGDDLRVAAIRIVFDVQDSMQTAARDAVENAPENARGTYKKIVVLAGESRFSRSFAKVMVLDQAFMIRNFDAALEEFKRTGRNSARTAARLQESRYVEKDIVRTQLRTPSGGAEFNGKRWRRLATFSPGKLGSVAKRAGADIAEFEARFLAGEDGLERQGTKVIAGVACTEYAARSPLPGSACVAELGGRRVALETRVTLSGKPIVESRAIALDDSFCVNKSMFDLADKGDTPMLLTCPGKDGEAAASVQIDGTVNDIDEQLQILSTHERLCRNASTD